MTTQTKDKTAGRNRRRSVRRDAKPGVRVACRKGRPGAGANLAVSLMDMSEGGVRLVVNQPLDDGQPVEVALTEPGGQEITLGGRVMWSLAGVADGGDWVGILFDSRVPEATVLGLTYVSENV